MAREPHSDSVTIDREESGKILDHGALVAVAKTAGREEVPAQQLSLRHGRSHTCWIPCGNVSPRIMMRHRWHFG